MLSISNLSGGYSHMPVIHHLTFDVYPSEMVGLIGLNGAGKSTTIKHILGLLQPMEGKITLHDKTLEEDPSFFRRSIGYIPESPQFYEELTLWEHLELTAYAYDLTEEQLKDRGESLLNLFQMEKKRNWFPEVMSKGMKQKLMILSTFLIEPDFLIIDEPFIGLDPLAIQSLLQLLEQRKKRGTGILLSTHILNMAEKYCDRFLLLHNGEIFIQGTLDEIRTQLKQPNRSLEELFLLLTRSQQSDEII